MRPCSATGATGDTVDTVDTVDTDDTGDTVDTDDTDDTHWDRQPDQFALTGRRCRAAWRAICT